MSSPGALQNRQRQSLTHYLRKPFTFFPDDTVLIAGLFSGLESNNEFFFNISQKSIGGFK